MKILTEKALMRYASAGGSTDKEGYLQKRGELNKGYQKRWFVLKGNLLFYYEKRTDREPIGVIVLEGCTIELAEETVDDYTFQINFQGSASRTYILSAESQKVLESWMKALSAAGYDYMKLMVSELQQKLIEASTEGQRKVVEEAERQSRILTQTYLERQELEKTGSRNSIYSDTKRINPFNKRTSSSEYESCDLFNLMEAEAPGPYSPRESWSQRPARSFLQMHEEIGCRVKHCCGEWQKLKQSKEKVLNGGVGNLKPSS